MTSIFLTVNVMQHLRLVLSAVPDHAVRVSVPKVDSQAH